MQGPSSRDYFERRAEQERLAAEQAGNERAAHSHRELAAYYRKLASGSADASGTDERTGDGILSKGFRIVP